MEEEEGSIHKLQDDVPTVNFLDELQLILFGLISFKVLVQFIEIFSIFFDFVQISFWSRLCHLALWTLISFSSNTNIACREILVTKSSSQPSSPISSSQPQFPGQVFSSHSTSPPSPNFNVNYNFIPNFESQNQLSINGKFQNSQFVSMAEFYPQSIRQSILDELSADFGSEFWKHVFITHAKIGDGYKGEKSQLYLSLSQIQKAAKSVVNCPNLIVKSGKADFILVGNFSKVIGLRRWLGVESNCWSLSVVYRNSQTRTIIPITNQFTIPNPNPKWFEFECQLVHS